MATDAEMRSILLLDLDEGEKLLWSGRPDPARSMRFGFALWIFAIPWTALGIFWICGPIAIRMANHDSHASTMEFWFPLVAIPFVLVGLALLSTPFFLRLKARRTVYGITNKRVIILVTGRSKTVESYKEADIGDFVRKELPNGSGDLTFARKYYRDGDGERQGTHITFTGIRDVRSVEQLMRDTFPVGY